MNATEDATEGHQIDNLCCALSLRYRVYHKFQSFWVAESQQIVLATRTGESNEGIESPQKWALGKLQKLLIALR